MRRFFIGLLVFIGLAAAGAFGLFNYYLVTDDRTAPQMAGAVTHGSLTFDGRDRSYLTYKPQSLKPGAPLVIVMHGSDGDGSIARASTFYDFDLLADRHGFLVVYPDGFERHWNGCRKHGPYAANLMDIDDIGFLRELTDQLVKRYNLDRSQVFATGISNGGHMAYRLAFEAPDLVRAVAPVIANIPAPSNMACSESRKPVPIMIMNGTDDPLNPYEGGPVELYGSGYRGDVLSARQSADYFARLADADPDPAISNLPDANRDDGTHIRILSWQGKDGGLSVPVKLVEVEGGGHTFPHPTAAYPRILGQTSHDAHGAQIIWDFFQSVR